MWKATGGEVQGGKTTVMLWTDVGGPRCLLDFHVEMFTWQLDVFGAHVSAPQPSAYGLQALQIPALRQD